MLCSFTDIDTSLLHNGIADMKKDGRCITFFLNDYRLGEGVHERGVRLRLRVRGRLRLGERERLRLREHEKLRLRERENLLRHEWEE